MPKRCIGSAEKSAEKGARKVLPVRGNASEKKSAPVPDFLPHRMSISERKPVEKSWNSRVPRPNGARKGLDFSDKSKLGGKIFC